MQAPVINGNSTQQNEPWISTHLDDVQLAPNGFTQRAEALQNSFGSVQFRRIDVKQTCKQTQRFPTVGAQQAIKSDSELTLLIASPSESRLPARHLDGSTQPASQALDVDAVTLTFCVRQNANALLGVQRSVSLTLFDGRQSRGVSCAYFAHWPVPLQPAMEFEHVMLPRQSLYCASGTQPFGSEHVGT